MTITFLREDNYATMGFLGMDSLPKVKDDKNQHSYLYSTTISYVSELLICLKWTYPIFYNHAKNSNKMPNIIMKYIKRKRRKKKKKAK